MIGKNLFILSLFLFSSYTQIIARIYIPKKLAAYFTPLQGHATQVHGYSTG